MLYKWPSEDMSFKVILIFATMYVPQICVILTFIVSLSYCKVIQNPDNDDSNIYNGVLKGSNILCRHGDRNIRFTFPNDPYHSPEYWPGGFEQLTNTGKQQHFSLGQYLRERYSKLIGNGEYSSDKIYVLSTDTDRTLMSAEANLAGFFPPSDDQIWHEHINWQPIPVHTIPHEEDYILHATAQCDRYDLEMMKYLTEDNRFEKTIDSYRPSIDYIKKYSGIENMTLYDIEHKIYDTLNVERQNGFEIPTWSEPLIKPGGPIERLVFSWYATRTATTELKKLKSGFLLKEMLEHFVNKCQGILEPDRSIWLYFAHDHTIINLLHTLGLYRPHQPPYASCVFIELYEDYDGSHYIQIFYRNSTDSNVPPMHIPNCGIKCKLPKMFEIYADVLPSQDYRDECALASDESMPPSGNPANSIL